MKRIQIGPISCTLSAPAPLVYQMLSAVGQGPQQDGERAAVLERDGDELVCVFWTRVALPAGLARVVRTRELVKLRPPDAIEYEHLDGPMKGLRESISLTAAAGRRTRMTYSGTYEPRDRLDAVRTYLVARPAIHRTMRQHFEDLRQRAENRAARSRVFPRDG